MRYQNEGTFFYLKIRITLSLFYDEILSRSSYSIQGRKRPNVKCRLQIVPFWAIYS